MSYWGTELFQVISVYINVNLPPSFTDRTSNLNINTDVFHKELLNCKKNLIGEQKSMTMHKGKSSIDLYDFTGPHGNIIVPISFSKQLNLPVPCTMSGTTLFYSQIGELLDNISDLFI